MSGPALEALDLGVRYARRWALRDCTFWLPEGRVAALIGANGAGKSTLLNAGAGLLRPSVGQVRIGGTPVRAGRADGLDRVGFVAQDVPLYRSLTADEHARIGQALNRVFDTGMARARWRELDIPSDQPVGRLSGGQRAQVALTLALAKRPSLLLLDEPLAALDPLARRELLQTLMGAVAEGVTVLLSSHLLAELERVCDFVIVISGGRMQVVGEADELVATHWWVTSPEPRALPRGCAVVDERPSGRGSLALVRSRCAPPAVDVATPTLEDVVLAYLARPDASAFPGPELAEAAS